ncbi:serine/threonine-protein kinase [Streptomyces sp. NPDC046727]|uniref:serine/threonine-protein kinase n=1 Tax=Streptomyces sp. NPDC046727 TaxID=3155373 RepID=UPI003405E7D1
MTENQEWAPGMTLLGEFTVEKDLGTGSYGRVALVRAERSDERYAVKRLHSEDPVHQGRLLVEAQRWIALPAHPYVVECRFTRSIGDRAAIFSEYAPGGSLHDSIQSGALYRGGPAQALRRVLTVGVQTAWGLDAAHAAGLLHLDVKPANILFDDQEAAKIADFGLAAVPRPHTEESIHAEAYLDSLVGGLPEGSDQRRIAEHARDITLARYAASRDEPVIATEGSFTAAYVSPEQEEGRALTVGADLWSWALTLLEMLVRERTWLSGAWAAEVLECAELGQLTEQALPLPPRIVELLRSCFRYDPSDRPRSLAEAADVLLAVAIEETGTALECEPPPRGQAPEPGWYGRELVSGGNWPDPRLRLHWAYRVAGLDLRDAVAFWPSRGGDNRSRLLEDLRTLREARRVLAELPASVLLGPDAPSADRLLDTRAGCAYDIGQVQEALGDLQGAVDGFREARDVLEAAPPELSRPGLPGVLNALAIALRKAGDPEQSLRVCDRAAAAALLVDDPVRAKTLLGYILMTKANAAAALGGGEDPAALYRAAHETFRSAGGERDAALALANLAARLEQAGRSTAAAPLWEEADAGLAAFTGPAHRAAEAARATLWHNRALAAAADSPEQYGHAVRAVELCTPLVRDFGWHQLCGTLGLAVFLRGRGEEGMDRGVEALASYREAAVLLRTAVLRDGRTELSEQLALAYDHEAALARTHEDRLRAVAPAQRAIGIWDRLVLLEGVARWGASLAESLHKLAETFREIDRLDEAQQALARGFAVLDDPACGADGDTDMVRSLLLMEQGIVYRRQGRPAAAYKASEAAIALLDAPWDRSRARTWLGARRNMANVFMLAQRYDAAALTEAETAVRTAEWAACEILTDSDLADVFGLLAEKLRLLGNAERAADTARVALGAYGRLAAAGRTDVAGLTVRMWRMLGLALLGAGDGAGALAAFEEVLGAAEAGNDPDAESARIADVAAELRATLGARPDDVPQRLAAARRGLKDAVEALRSGVPFVGLEMLECTAATLGLLVDAHPHREVAEVSASVSALLAFTARANRCLVLAERALRQSGAAYGLLVDGHAGHEAFERWLNSSLLRASILRVWGQEQAARDLLDEMVENARRVGGERAARHWRAEADQVLRGRHRA